MPRGYRSVFFAIVGWLALTGQNDAATNAPKQNQEAVEQQRSTDTQQAANTIAAAIGNTVQTAVQDTGCKDRKDQRQSDLCAQWKAADAARDAANFALATLLISILGTGLLYWTLRETRQTARRELRAYLFPTGASLFEVRKGENAGMVMASLEVKNSGQTPAFRVVHWGELVLCRDGSETSLIVPKLEGPSNPVPPGGSIHKHRSLTTNLTIKDRADISAGKAGIFLYGRVEYFDAFKVHRFTDYRLHYSGVWPPPKGHQMYYSDEGNDAS